MFLFGLFSNCVCRYSIHWKKALYYSHRCSFVGMSRFFLEQTTHHLMYNLTSDRNSADKSYVVCFLMFSFCLNVLMTLMKNISSFCKLYNHSSFSLS